MVRKLVVACLALGVIAAACSSPQEPLSVEDYSTRLSALFNFEGPESASGSESDTEFSSTVFMYIEDAVAEMRALEPPADLAADHDEMVSRLEDIQEGAADYLREHGLKETDISPTDVGDYLVASDLAGPARAACVTVARRLRELGAPLQGEFSCFI